MPGGFSGKLAYTISGGGRAGLCDLYRRALQPARESRRPIAGQLQDREGRQLPAGRSDEYLYAGLTWRYLPLGFSSTLEALGRARIYADDRNSDAAAGYWSANLRAGFEQETRHWRFSESPALITWQIGPMSVP